MSCYYQGRGAEQVLIHYPSAAPEVDIRADGRQWRSSLDYPDFQQWSERPDPEQESILEQVLKKWVGAARRSWSERADQLLHRGLPERQGTAPSRRAMTGQEGVWNQAPIAVDTQDDPRDHRERTDSGWGFGDQRRDDLSMVPNVLVDGGYLGRPCWERRWRW